MAVYDLGDVVNLGITITDTSGNNANATAVVATITAPDGTVYTPGLSNSAAGLYDVSFTPTQSGRHTIRWVATGANASAYMDEFNVRDMTHTSVISLDQAKAHLNIPASNTTNDEEIRRFIDAATDLAENYVGCILGRQTFTNEKYDGNTDHLRIRNPKVISIASVYENGNLLNAADYLLDPTGQRLYRVTTVAYSASNYYGIWAPGANNITVTYTAGFLNPPGAVQQGVLEILRHLWQTQRGAVSVMGRAQPGDDFYPASTYSLPRRAMELLDPASLPGMA